MLDPRLRLQLPLGDPGRLLGDGHRGRRRPPLDQRHELVPPARAALRRVRLLARGDPRLRRLPRPLRPRLQHEPGPPQPGDRDALREPRRRRRPHRLHAVPDLPRPPPPRGLARRAAAARRRRDQAEVPATTPGGRPTSSTATSTPAARSPASRPRSPATATLTPPAARPSWSSEDRFDFLLLSLPDNDNYSHRNGPEASVESIATRRRVPSPCWSRRAGGLDRFLDEHAVILVADHAQTDVHRGLPLAELLGRTSGRSCSPPTSGPELAQLAVSPTGRAAHVYLLPGEGERADPAAVGRAAGGDRGGRPGLPARGRRGRAAAAGPSRGCRPPAASGRWSSARGERLRFRPGDGRRRPARRALGDRGRARGAGGAGRGRRLRSDDLPGPAGPGLVGADRAALGRLRRLARRGLRGGRLGRRHPRRRRQPRRPARRRLARAAALRRLRPGVGRRAEQWTLRDVAPVVRAHFGLGAGRDGATGAAAATRCCSRSTLASLALPAGSAAAPAADLRGAGDRDRRPRPEGRATRNARTAEPDLQRERATTATGRSPTSPTTSESRWSWSTPKSGEVTESWTGYQVAWKMARGYSGAVRPQAQRPLRLPAALPDLPHRPGRLAAAGGGSPTSTCWSCSASASPTSSSTGPRSGSRCRSHYPVLLYLLGALRCGSGSAAGGRGCGRSGRPSGCWSRRSS